MTAIVWFRRDLRVRDNPALVAALGAHELVMPVFCLDDRLLAGRHSSTVRSAFLRSCLVCLDEALRERGSRLVIRDGLPQEQLPRLADQLGAEEVYAAHDISPFARERDQAVSKALADRGVRLRLRPGAFAVDDLGAIRTQTGTPYSVFTAFHRRWVREPRRRVEAAPRRLPLLPDGLDPGSLPELGELPGHAAIEPGEDGARRRLNGFLRGDVEEYHRRHDDLAASGTSGLSAYLHLGCLSPRQVESRLPETDGGEAVRRQLCWRDFYAHVLFHNPDNAVVEQQERFRQRLHWSGDRQLFDAWCEGRTGYPVVDAGMRELKTTGLMHNRARMVAGSFLVKDLGIDWRWGERWFMRRLLDGDEANNNGNWQWIASVGVDPQPPARRIYNPTRQFERFDPDGLYVRRHVPELATVPGEFLAEPWTMPAEVQRECGCVIGRDYPEPIVDHAAARRAAIERYAAARERAA